MNVTFEQQTYAIGEDDGSVTVCVRVTGEFERPVEVNISTEPDSAQGESTLCACLQHFYRCIDCCVTIIGGSDFISVSEVLTFEPSLNGSRLCVMVDVINDSVLEEEQTFFLVLSAADPDIAVQEDSAVVFIMDNDGIFCVMLILLFNLLSVCFRHSYWVHSWTNTNV